MVPAIKVTYFPLKGRAEAIRLALHIGGYEFEDERLAAAGRQALKDAGVVPFQSFPTMTVDGEVFAETGALLRYAGKLSGLYPKSEKTTLKADMIVDVLETVLIEVLKDSSKEGREKFLKEVVPRYIGAIDKIYTKEKGPYLLGEQMSIADLRLVSLVLELNNGVRVEHLPAGCLDEYSNVMGAVKAVSDHPKVKEWNAMHA